MLWWSMLEVSLASMAANLPVLSYCARDRRLIKAFQRLLSFSNLSGSQLWRAKKSGSDPETSPERGTDSNQTSAEAPKMAVEVATAYSITVYQYDSQGAPVFKDTQSLVSQSDHPR